MERILYRGGVKLIIPIANYWKAELRMSWVSPEQ